MRGWHDSGGAIEVETDGNRYSGDRLIVCAGAWAGGLLPELDLPLQVLRKHLHWYACPGGDYDCGFFFELDDGEFYGFPSRDGRLKLGEHSGGEAVEDALSASREPDEADTARIERFIDNHLPGVSPERLRHEVCFYTMTPDRQFIVDRHPGCERVAFAAGLSGHGFINRRQFLPTPKQSSDGERDLDAARTWYARARTSWRGS